jgi:hypothetical protein
MEVTVVQVVDVTSMLDGRVAAAIAVDVIVMAVRLVRHVVFLRMVARARRFLRSAQTPMGSEDSSCSLFRSRASGFRPMGSPGCDS